ncbi:MAG: chorismate synthase [Pseudomonadota bacterium]
MSGNKFGKLFNFISWGESHGEAIGCVIDGVPPNIALSTDDIQIFLDKRKPAQSRFTTQRKEADKVHIMSGVFEGKTTGTPISLIIYNQDHRSKDYSQIADQFRPGHADYTYQAKYGIRDYRGGGRSSARETAMRVAAGAVARKILDDKINIRAAMIQIGDKKINYDNWDDNVIDDNPFWCPDIEMVDVWSKYLDDIRKQGLSIGAIIEVRVSGVPAGFGEPVYDKLDADIAKAIMSINAVKSVEIGAGFDAAALTGKDNADEIYLGEDNQHIFSSNNAGGILGGISSGQDIIVRFAVKPTSSMLVPVKSIDKNNNEIEIMTKGRHDPCVGIRAVPVAEAMLAITLADHYLRHKAQCL